MGVFTMHAHSNSVLSILRKVLKKPLNVNLKEPKWENRIACVGFSLELQDVDGAS